MTPTEDLGGAAGYEFRNLNGMERAKRLIPAEEDLVPGALVLEAVT